MHITWKWKDAGCQDGLKYGVQVNKLWLLPGFSYTAEYLLLITPLLSMLINITSSFSKAFFSLSSPSISASWKPHDDAPASKYLKEGLRRKTLHNSQINNESQSPFAKVLVLPLERTPHENSRHAVISSQVPLNSYGWW